MCSKVLSVSNAPWTKMDGIQTPCTKCLMIMKNVDIPMGCNPGNMEKL